MMAKVVAGHDGAEDHHDVFVEDAAGAQLAAARLAEGLEGVRRLHELGTALDFGREIRSR
jgi:hypothetical protein